MTDDIIVYTDGSCINNGGALDQRRAGIGIYFPGNNDFNCSEFLVCPPLTNIRAEMYAIVKCLLIIMNNREYFEKYYTKNILIKTDSQFTIDLVTKWLAGWKKNGYQTSKKKPIKNRDLVVMLDNTIEQAKYQGYQVNFQHVRAHRTEPKLPHTSPQWIDWFCNHRADQLAVRGSKSTE